MKWLRTELYKGCVVTSGRKKALLGAFDKSANDEHERSILTKLKQQCGLKEGGDGALSAISRPPLFIWIKTLDPALRRGQMFHALRLKLLVLGA